MGHVAGRLVLISFVLAAGLLLTIATALGVLYALWWLSQFVSGGSIGPDDFALTEGLSARLSQ